MTIVFRWPLSLCIYIFRNFWLGWDGWVPTCVSLFSPVAIGVWAMELNFEATGGASDFSRQAELDSSQLNFDLESWDDGYVDLERNSQPHFGADSEHYSPSVSEPAESHVALQLSQYRDYNFQNSLRDAAFNNSTTLPDLPWESSLWKCIFDDEYDPLDAIISEIILVHRFDRIDLARIFVYTYILHIYIIPKKNNKKT